MRGKSIARLWLFALAAGVCLPLLSGGGSAACRKQWPFEMKQVYKREVPGIGEHGASAQLNPDGDRV